MDSLCGELQENRQLDDATGKAGAPWRRVLSRFFGWRAVIPNFFHRIFRHFGRCGGSPIPLSTSRSRVTPFWKVYDSLHVPVGVSVKKGVIDKGTLNAWWRGRAIPASRMGIRDALHKLQISDAKT